MPSVVRATSTSSAARTVRVERQRLHEGSIGPTQTTKSPRTVPLGQIVVDQLAQHIAAHGARD